MHGQTKNTIARMVGKKFGMLTVHAMAPRRSDKLVRWLCLCDCEKTTEVSTAKLTTGHTRSCGCLVTDVNRKAHSIDLVGESFGSLVVLNMAGLKEKPNGSRYQTWLCQCDCGNTVIASTDSLRGGHRTDCREMARSKHGKKIAEGDKYGILTVVSVSADRSVDNEILWNCLCECGRTTKVRGYSLKSGGTQSCGCRRFTFYDGLRLNSRWELFWYIAAKMRGLDVEYEPVRVQVFVDGKERKYIPDFRIRGTDKYYEIKGYKHELGMKKYAAATSMGMDIEFVDDAALHEWCGCLSLRMQRHYVNGGVEAVSIIISEALAV